jgi:DNA repair exonuclease SbcCD ATPase subunit
MQLRLQNIRNYTDKTFTFPNRGLILLDGHPQAGKSTIFCAILYALFGKSRLAGNLRLKQATWSEIQLTDFCGLSIVRHTGPCFVHCNGHEGDAADQIIRQTLGVHDVEQFLLSSYIPQTQTAHFLYQAPKRQLLLFEQLIFGKQPIVYRVLERLKQDRATEKNAAIRTETTVHHCLAEYERLVPPFHDTPITAPTIPAVLGDCSPDDRLVVEEAIRTWIARRNQRKKARYRLAQMDEQLAALDKQQALRAQFDALPIPWQTRWTRDETKYLIRTHTIRKERSTLLAQLAKVRQQKAQYTSEMALFFANHTQVSEAQNEPIPSEKWHSFLYTELHACRQQLEWNKLRAQWQTQLTACDPPMHDEMAALRSDIDSYSQTISALELRARTLPCPCCKNLLVYLPDALCLQLFSALPEAELAAKREGTAVEDLKCNLQHSRQQLDICIQKQAERDRLQAKLNELGPQKASSSSIEDRIANGSRLLQETDFLLHEEAKLNARLDKIADDIADDIADNIDLSELVRYETDQERLETQRHTFAQQLRGAENDANERDLLLHEKTTLLRQMEHIQCETGTCRKQDMLQFQADICAYWQRRQRIAEFEQTRTMRMQELEKAQTAAVETKKRLGIVEAVQAMTLEAQADVLFAGTAAVTRHMNAYVAHLFCGDDTHIAAEWRMYRISKRGRKNVNHTPYVNLAVTVNGDECDLTKDLCGSEQSRLMLATTLAMRQYASDDTGLLMIDEGLNALDEERVARVLFLLQSLAKDSLILVINHRISHGQFDAIVSV